MDHVCSLRGTKIAPLGGLLLVTNRTVIRSSKICLLIATRTRRNVIEPILLHRFVGPESIDTSTKAGFQVNCSWKSISSPFSFCREKTIPKRPEVVAQREASTDRTAVHFRSIVGGRISENRISLNAKVGLQVSWPAAWATPTSPIPLARSPKKQDRYMLVLRLSCPLIVRCLALLWARSP